MPILTLMVEMVQANRIIRKFVRLRVLPPLRDVTKRPEEGATLRNKLCTLMTSPLHDLKHLSANFLFILCKESGMQNTFTCYLHNNIYLDLLTLIV